MSFHTGKRYRGRDTHRWKRVRTCLRNSSFGRTCFDAFVLSAPSVVRETIFSFFLAGGLEKSRHHEKRARWSVSFLLLACSRYFHRLLLLDIAKYLYISYRMAIEQVKVILATFLLSRDGEISWNSSLEQYLSSTNGTACVCRSRIFLISLTVYKLILKCKRVLVVKHNLYLNFDFDCPNRNLIVSNVRTMFYDDIMRC